MHKLMEFICDELDELERKAGKDGKLSMQEVQYMDTLAHAKKNLLKADEMMEDSEYSEAGDGNSYRRGRYSRRGGEGSSYDSSYARGRGARRNALGQYSRDDRASYGRYSMANDDFRMELQELMQDAPNEQIKQKLQNMMSEM